MNKIMIMALTCLCFTLGCITAPSPIPSQITTKDNTSSSTVPKREASTVSVTPSQVTAENAHQVTQALWDEMDHDIQKEMPQQKGSQASTKK